jgi:hypothetical protein
VTREGDLGHQLRFELAASPIQQVLPTESTYLVITVRCVIPVVCVTNEREEGVVNQHN